MRAIKLLGFLFLAAFAGLFFLYPTISLIWRGEGANFLPEVLGSSETFEILWFSLWQALASVLLTLVLAWPMAWLLGRLEFRGKGLISALLLVAFALPTLVVSISFLASFDLLGLEGLKQSVWAILAAHVFFNYAVVSRIIGDFWSKLDYNPKAAAMLLGAGKVRSFWNVTLPQLRPAIAAAAGIVFLFSFSSFGVILVLGGPDKSTLATEIWRQISQRQDFGTASALAIVQLVCVAAAVAVIPLFRSSRKYALVLTRDPSRSAEVPLERLTASPKRQRQTAALCLLSGALILGVPLAVLLYKSVSLRGGGWTLGFYQLLFESEGRTSFLLSSPLESIYNSLLFALIAALVSTAAGLIISLRIFYQRGRGAGSKISSSFWESILLMPLGVPAAVLGLGFLISFDEDPLNWRESFWLVPIAHSMIALPFVVRPCLAALRGVGDELRWAGRSLGSPPVRLVREIDMPALFRPLATGAGFAFVISLGDFGVSTFLVRDRATMPVNIFRLLSRPGEQAFGQAMALAVILMLMIAAAVLVINIFQKRAKQVHHVF